MVIDAHNTVKSKDGDNNGIITYYIYTHIIYIHTLPVVYIYIYNTDYLLVEDY